MTPMEAMRQTRFAKIAALPALMLQMLHPVVAHAVYNNGAGRLLRDPKQHLLDTERITMAVIGGDEDAAKQLLELHNRITVTLPRHYGFWSAGPTYHATEPRFLLWVFATLIETRLAAVEQIYGHPSPEHIEQLYTAMQPAGIAFGIPEYHLPNTYQALREYFVSMLKWLNHPSGQLAATEASAAVIESILSVRKFGIPMRPVFRVAAAALLPNDATRQACGLPWRQRERVAWWAMRLALRGAQRLFGLQLGSSRPRAGSVSCPPSPLKSTMPLSHRHPAALARLTQKKASQRPFSQ